MPSTYRSMRTRVKICGLTRTDDVRRAVDLGVDAIGLVFAEQSKRHVSIEEAIVLAREVPAFVSVVGLFVDASADLIEAVLDAVRIDLLQFHGEESPDACRRFGRPWVKALRMRPGIDVLETVKPYAGAQGILLDAYEVGHQGGTGKTFDWSMIPSALGPRVILAGGLAPSNVTLALQAVRPYALDVSSGVEEAPGLKDPDRMAAFLREVQEFDYRACRTRGL